jgi:hypothetical protein
MPLFPLTINKLIIQSAARVTADRAAREYCPGLARRGNSNGHGTLRGWMPRARAGDSLSNMTTKSPVPGMNPFFAQGWRDAHTRLITYLHDALLIGIGPEQNSEREDVADFVNDTSCACRSF